MGRWSWSWKLCADTIPMVTVDSVDTLYTEAKWKLLYSATARDGDCLGLGWNKISGYLHRYCRYILFVCRVLYLLCRIKLGSYSHYDGL